MRNKNKINFARELRQRQTEVEKLLWFKLRNRQLGGVKFTRQEVIGSYIVNFCSREHKLIIEVDGGHHNDEDAKKYDERRTNFLENKGYKVLRFWDNQVFNHLDGVLEEIYRHILFKEPSP